MNYELVSTMHRLLEDHTMGEILEALGVALQEYSSAVRMDYDEKDVGGRDYVAETMKVINTFGADIVLDVMSNESNLPKDSKEGQAFWNYIKSLKASEDQ